ncbi:hypothetical protein E6H31_00790 [Candidatus Bathyarchaeota archaeon]|nr:MAG: hypothetical protein E6H31_00790 [Candidatus Bathyarchaeota archaeon]
MSTGDSNTTSNAHGILTLSLNRLSQQISQYLRKNPGTAFILAFETLLVAAAVELIVGNVSAANAIGVYAFVALVVGVAFHAISVIKGSKEGKASP